ncbi:MAG: hypothetical protein AAB654_12585 [Acidobacteriota bacterium]
MTLDELRSSRQFTQAQLSQTLGITQAAVSKLEFRHDSYLSSVRKYIEAIGGKMEIHAVFPEGVIKLRGLDGDEKLTLLRGMARAFVRISPQLVGNTVPCRNSFTIVGVDDEERTLELEKDSVHHVYIPIRRILEVLPAPSTQKHASLVIKGRVEWFQHRNGGGWYFVE